MNIDEHIKHWANLCESNNEETAHIHEDIDDGSIIGFFSVNNPITEMGSIGTLEGSHRYFVYIRSFEREIPHFHVYDIDGKDKKKGDKKGTHTCIQISKNWYWKHGNYVDDLDKKTREQLDKFLAEVRTEDKYSSGVGKTNFVHTIEQWNDNNALDRNSPNWVNPQTTEKPDYTTLIDNLKNH